MGACERDRRPKASRLPIFSNLRLLNQSVPTPSAGASGAIGSSVATRGHSPNRALVVRSLPMSERLVIPGRAEAESELSVAHAWWQFSVRFNVAVSHSVPVVRMHERESRRRDDAMGTRAVLRKG
jgi:hypothetical protein